MSDVVLKIDGTIARDDVPSDDDTHDVNDEMLDEAYRRGLRVLFIGRVTSKTLAFLR